MEARARGPAAAAAPMRAPKGPPIINPKVPPTNLPHQAIFAPKEGLAVCKNFIQKQSKTKGFVLQNI